MTTTIEPKATKPAPVDLGSLKLPPGPKARYPMQFVVELAKDRIGLFKKMAEMGDVTHLDVWKEELTLVQDPDLIKQVLVTNQKNFVKGYALERVKVLLGEGLLTNEGESHLRQRRLAQPAFHKQRIEAYAGVMGAYADRISAEWTDGGMRDIHEDMMRLTLGVAGQTLFDEDVDGDASDVAQALDLSLRMFDLALLPGGTLLEYIPIPWVKKVHAARQKMDDLIFRMIRERRQDMTDRGDLLSMLIASQDSEDGTGMSDKQLRDEIVTIMMAAHETTAIALSWTWYLLSQNPEVEARLHAEVDSVLADGHAPTLEDYSKLTYTRKVFSESMRLYPPAWMLERRALNDCEIGGYKVKKGTMVMMSQFLMHRDPRWWDNPESFDPERWNPDKVAERPKFAYFPFGAGTRICIGEQFAWMEGILLIAAISRKWKFEHDPTHQVAMDPLVTLRPKYGMRMKFSKR